MNHRGFAVVGVVWLLVLLIGVTATLASSVQFGLHRSRNRLRLTRMEWAREACVDILLGRYRRPSAPKAGPSGAWKLDAIDLGRGVWCTVQVEDPGSRVNLNLADSSALLRLLGDSALVSRVIAGRPLEAVDQVLEGFDRDDQAVKALLRTTTVRGTGRVNLNSASREVLKAVTDLSAAAITSLILNRSQGRFLTSFEEFGLTHIRESAGGLHETMARVTLAPEQLVAEVVGGIRGTPLRARAVLTLAPTLDRLAVIRRESE